MKKYVALILFIWFFLACEKVESIVDFPMVPSKLVANCEMNEDSVWMLQLSKSLSVLDNADIKKIDTATIQVFEDGQLLEVLSPLGDEGLYFGQTKPKADKLYRISVGGVAGFDSIYAEGSLPEKAYLKEVKSTVIDSFYQTDDWGYSYGYMEVEFTFNIEDNPNQENFYGIRAYKLDSFYLDYDSTQLEVYKEYLGFDFDDPLFEESSNWNLLLLKDAIFNGQTVEVKAKSNYYDYKPGVNVYFECISYNKAAYLYKVSYNTYLNVANNPFAEPVQVYSNFENGYGILSGQAITENVIQL